MKPFLREPLRSLRLRLVFLNYYIVWFVQNI